ncbi:MAG: hypothetical protein AAGK22_03415 [Acidobacteriota bacterium]
MKRPIPAVLYVGLVSLPTLLGLATAAFGASGASAGDATFYGDVLPILQTKCQDCHRPSGTNFGGMRAPMSLMTYEEVRPWARSIARQVTAREMPPWDAHPQHDGTFANERTLTPEEIETVVGWVGAGAPSGDAAQAPPQLVFEATDGWNFGKPDLVVTMPEPYLVRDDVDDLYAAFTVDLTEEMLPEDAWVVAFECQPDSEIIHHFNLHLLEPGPDGTLPPPPTVSESGQISPEGAGNYMGGVSSGSEANAYPEGYGFLLKKGSRITFDIHYHKESGEGTGVWDQSSIGFKFVKGPLKEVRGGMPPFMNFTFAIPPGAENHQVGPLTQTLQHDVDVIALMPHMHMRGKAAKFEAFYPDGSSEVLLDVPSFDFSWQTVYYYRDLKRLPKGTRVEYTAWFDNSEDKASSYGFDASRTVTFGQPSTDEMVMGFAMSAKAEEP